MNPTYILFLKMNTFYKTNWGRDGAATCFLNLFMVSITKFKYCSSIKLDYVPTRIRSI